ncbi:MFS transporter [Lactobacillus salivarius]|uniref:MFS transporter n=1 Tax=Ligilactobacillus salivarius TaxID=1624 RepID=A0A6A8LR26_9LACO|nr:MFS transporter [Ligilactobacillus salivarius]MSE07514.1 MFS transporter [Ligilactobacillus salivarius]
MITFIKNNKHFTTITIINLFSKLGDRLFYIAMLSTAATLPHKNLAVMLVSFSETLPILCSFFLGSLADKKTKKSLLLIQTSVLRALIYIIIGILFHYSPTLYLIILSTIFNFLSDLAGNFSSALVIPFTKTLVKVDEMPQAQGIVSIASQLVNVFSTLLGSFLLVFISKTLLAWLNSSIFLLTGLGFLIIRKLLSNLETHLPHTIDTLSTWKLVKYNFIKLYQDRITFIELLQLTLINGFFGGLIPVFTLFVQKSTHLLPNSISIALLSACITIFMIIGNAISSKFMKNFNNIFFTYLIDFAIVVTGFVFYSHNTFFILLLVSFVALLLGIISPRFSAKVINKYPIENVGGIITTVNSLLVLTPPLTSIIFPLFAVHSLTTAYLSIIIYGVSLLLVNVISSYKH